MRRILVVLSLLASMSGCGSDPDVRFVSDGGGYGFPDAASGSIIQLATIAVCVTEGATASVTAVRFVGSDFPAIDAFAVQPRTPQDVGGYMGADPDAIDDTVEVTEPCPSKDPLIAPQTGQGLVLRTTVPDLDGRIDLRTLEVDYVIDGDQHSAQIPIAVAICPPGDVQADDDLCGTSDAPVD